MNACYFWRAGKLEILPYPANVVTAVNAGMLDCPCVDSFVSPSSPGRYGIFIRDPNRRYPSVWDDWTADQLPLEFRTHLLLLGVS